MDRRQISLFLLVLLVGLSIRGFVLSGPPEQLVTIVPDDAFYYMETAKHIVAGEGSTFDGINPTNGYHPLWMVLLLPIVALIKDPWTIVRATIALGLAFNIGAAALVFAALRRSLNVWYVPVIGVALYYLNARSMTTSLTGMDSMVSSFFFALALYLSVRQFDSSTTSLTRTAGLGLCLGLLFLARTDNAFYIMAFSAVAVWRESPARRVKAAAVMGTVMAVVASPWLLWNYFTFGSMLQSSGFAIPYVLRESLLADGQTSVDLIIFGAKKFLGFVGYYMYYFYLGFPIIAYLPALAGTIYLIVRKWNKLKAAEYLKARRVIDLLGVLAAGALAVVFVHTFIRWYPRNYYFDQVIILSIFGFAIGLTLLRPDALVARLKSKSVLAAKLSIIMILVVTMVPASYSGYRLVTRGASPHQVEFLEAARWLRENTATTDIIAGFNVGIVSFFSERTVINLDGAINTAAYAAIRQRRLFNYIEDMKVQYFVDYDPLMLDMYRHFLGTESASIPGAIVKHIDRPGVSFQGASIAVYRLQ